MTRVLFLGGAARSGSTVIAQYLESHLDLVHVGELRYVWTRGLGGRNSELCECRRPLVECPFWGEVFAIAFPEGLDLARARMVDLLGQVDRMRHAPTNLLRSGGATGGTALADYGEILGRLYAAVRQVSGAAVVLDSTKEPSYLYALRTIADLQVDVIHLVRDSRAVAYSWTRKKLRPEVHWQEQPMKTRSAASSAGHWMESNIAMEAVRAGGVRPLRVRYEDFAATPDRTVDRVRERFALSSRTDLVTDRHSFSGNPIRFSAEPLKVKADAAWVQQMPVADRRKVSVLTAPLRWRYGYVG